MKADDSDRWAAAWAIAGAGLWVVLAALAGFGKARFGVIELLFLFAPLVIVPLGLELGRSTAPTVWPPAERAARTWQPLAAVLTVTSFWFGPGRVAATLALPWAFVTVLVALAGSLSLFRGRSLTLVSVVVNVGRIDLAIAGVWLCISRLGLRPLGVQEPIVLLTAVHFHYTGFATALLAGTMLAFARLKGRQVRILSVVVALVVFIPFVLAAGFVFSSLLKVTAALLLSLAIITLAGFLFGLSKDLGSATARGFLRASGATVVVGMGLASIYALCEVLGKDWLLIPRMAITHGVLNGLGFVLLGLLGWLIEGHARPLRPSA
jgi:hypothetical protein